MPTNSIPFPSPILYLPDALKRYPEHWVVFYHRVSSPAQAGTGNVKLIEIVEALMFEVRKRVGGKLLETPFFDVEEGQVNIPRPALRRAAKHALENPPSMILAWDRSRFIRPVTFCHRTNREAIETPEELAWLHSRTYGIPLVTLVDPTLTESQRHSLATKRSGRCGRQSKLVWPITYQVLEMLESVYRDGEKGSLKSIADAFGLDKQVVYRFWCEWDYLEWPSRAYLDARKQGWLSKDGRRLVSKPK
jgi:DNA invertase Pin-like site-specific DNA recombinase